MATGDGIFGLGGILFLASADAPRGSATITDPSVPAKLSWDVCYRLPAPGDELTVSLTGKPDVVLRATDAEPPGAVRHAVLTSDAPGATLKVAVTKGFPEMCGVVAEADPEVNPGVVLDTLGINGARFATPLAWNEASWASELARRDPELVILEYGTNELSDYPVKTTAFTEPIRAVMARIRKVRPDVDCVVLAPTDRADTEERVPIGRDAVREGALESGCAFWDTYTIMGGKGAIRAWQSESPPRAAKDGIHLSWRGYRDLGTKLAEDLLRGYTP
jgi:lysophospholipase L1-like esterase